MQITMKTSGVESLNAAGNIFIGQVHTQRTDCSLYVENSRFVEGEGAVSGLVLYHTRFCITDDSIIGK